MTKHLYSKTDDIAINSEITPPTQEQINEQLEALNNANLTVNSLVQNSPTPVVSSSNQIFENIKDIFTNDKEIKPQQKFFTPGKGKIAFNIDGTIFTPTPVVLLSGKNFEVKYAKQIESYIFTDKDSIDPDKLIHLIFLMEYIKKDQVPVQIVTGQFKRYQVKMVNALNTFFVKNYSTLSSIHVMFTGMTSIATNGESNVE